MRFGNFFKNYVLRIVLKRQLIFTLLLKQMITIFNALKSK
jgi:hypothetical protein